MHSMDRPYDKGRGRGGQPPHEDGVEQGHAGARLLLEVGLEGEKRPPAQHLVQYSTVQCSAVQYSTVQYSTVQYSTTFQGFCSDDLVLKTSTVGFPSNHQVDI